MRRRRIIGEERGKVVINLAPLVDISLSLVIIFIVSLPFILESGLFVSRGALTKAKAQEVERDDVKVNIYIRKDGVVFLNEKPVNDLELPYYLKELIKRSVSGDVILSADSEVVYRRVIEIIDLAKQSGARDVYILRRKG